MTVLPHVPLRRVKSTLLVASCRMVSKMGREQDYRAALPSQYHRRVFESVAGGWVAVDVAVAHYRACEALGLSPDQQVEVGRTVGEQIRGTLAGTIVNLSKQLGVEPWTILTPLPRIWRRLFDGSSVIGWKLGPKEALIELQQNPVADILYFRNALCGQLMGALDLFCKRSYVTAINAPSALGSFAMRVQWA